MFKSNSLSHVILILLFIISASVGPAQKEKAVAGFVIAVKDGDTIEILTKEKKQIKVRMFGIDCPEKGQAFGSEAKKFTSDRCFNEEVKVLIKGYDVYKRLLGEVILKNGSSLNQELVGAGYAWHFTKYSKSLILDNLEQEARIHRKGLWANNQPLPPWEFRQLKKKSTNN